MLPAQPIKSRKNSFISKTLFLTFFYLLSTPALAGISVNKAVIEFLHGKSTREDIVVRNDGSEQAFVKVEVFEVVNPGTPKEKRVQHANPKEMGLIVSPAKMALPPGGTKMVRMVNFNSPLDKERIYRVKVVPVVSELFAEESGIKMLVGYELLVMVRPETPTPLIKAERKGKKLFATNTGNTNVLMFNGSQCRGENDCEELAAKRMYPGASWEFDLPMDGPVDFYLQGAEMSNTPVHYP